MRLTLVVLPAHFDKLLRVEVTVTVPSSNSLHHLGVISEAVPLGADDRVGSDPAAFGALEVAGFPVPVPIDRACQPIVLRSVVAGPAARPNRSAGAAERLELLIAHRATPADSIASAALSIATAAWRR